MFYELAYINIAASRLSPVSLHVEPDTAAEQQNFVRISTADKMLNITFPGVRGCRSRVALLLQAFSHENKPLEAYFENSDVARS